MSELEDLDERWQDDQRIRGRWTIVSGLPEIIAFDETRIVAYYDDEGYPESHRSYTPEENEEADEALAQYQIKLADEERQAVLHQAILEATSALIDEAHEDGEAWVQPTGAHNAYGMSVNVMHLGESWRSEHPANVWEPAPGPWWTKNSAGVDPWSPDGYYRVGNIVSWEGFNWECTHEHQAGPGWEPDNPTMYAVWKKLV